MSLVRNERLNLAANFLNAISISLIGIAVLRPVIENGAALHWVLAPICRIHPMADSLIAARPA